MDRGKYAPTTAVVDEIDLHWESKNVEQALEDQRPDEHAMHCRSLLVW
jgi:hypothetical protein